MSNRYLILKFKGARLFRSLDPKNKNTDYSVPIQSDNGYKTEKDYDKKVDLGMKSFREPITVYQISNLIHVLFNERPVPTLRQVVYSKNMYYFNKANNSYLKITTEKIAKDDYYYELIRTKKAAYNSWDKFVQLNWEVIRRYVDSKDKMIALVDVLNKVLLVDSKSLDFNSILAMVEKLPKNERLKIYDVIKNQGDISGLIYAFGRYKDNKFEKQDLTKVTCKADKMAKTVNNGISKCASLSGEIAVPVTDEDIAKLEKFSNGCATLLDGGMVWIDSVKYDYELSSDGYTLVSDISTEMI